MSNPSHILSVLKEQGYKQTRLRTLLISHLVKIKKPLAAIDILKILKEKGLVVNKSTVYREVEFLLHKKIIVEINFGDGKQRYEIAGLPHHHHLVCTNCGKIEDIIADKDLEVLEKKIKRSKGFSINSHNLEFFGICKKCQ